MTSWRKRKGISYSFFHKGIDLTGHLDSQQNSLILSGDRHAHFDMFFHKITSWIEVEGLVEIATVDETTKNAFCQEKSGLPGISLVSTILDLRNETKCSGFLDILATAPDGWNPHPIRAHRRTVPKDLSGLFLLEQSLEVGKGVLGQAWPLFITYLNSLPL